MTAINEKRRDPREQLHSTVLIAVGARAWLALVQDVSAGGAKVAKPLDWHSPGYAPLTLYFIFDQDTVIRIQANLVRDAPDHLGFAFKTGQNEQIGRLLYETRFAEY